MENSTSHKPELYFASGYRRLDAGGGNGNFIPSVILHDMQGKILFQKDLKFLPHFIIQDPSRPESLVILDKGGPIGAIGTVSDGKLNIRYFKASAGQFSIYGHGQFFENGRKFIGTERGQKSEGQLVLRDGESFEVLKVIPLPGFGPHDCVFVEGEALLAVAMDGMRDEGETRHREHRGCVILFDLRTLSVVKQLDCERETGLGHLACHDDVLIAMETGLVGEVTDGLVSVGKVSGKLNSLKAREEINKWRSLEALSAEIDPLRMRLIVTNPLGNIVTIWNLKERSLIGHVEIPYPMGVLCSAAADTYVVSSATGFLFHIDPESCSLRTMLAPEIPGQYNSHLCGIYL